jgi:hypothetical protein
MIHNILILLFIISCGNVGIIPEEKDPRSARATDPEFVKYIEQFEDTCQTKIHDLPMEFGTTEDFQKNPTFAGYCEVFSGEKTYKQIKVNYNWWAGASNFLRAWLIFHELGHCHFNLGHDDRVIAPGSPINIMHSNIPWAVSSNRLDFYLNGLCLMGGSIKRISNE